MKAIIAPSILSADFSKLGDEVNALQQAGVRWLHLDIMDGNFTPNITFGAPVVSALRKQSNMFFDAHLMIERPERYIDDFAVAGADLIVVHIETTQHLQGVLANIHEHGLKAGVAINPGTDFSLLKWLLSDIDLIEIMGVNPGFSGQKFIPITTNKISACRKFLDEKGYENIPIEVDGGVSLDNIAELLTAGAEVLVSGSAFFKHSNYAHGLQQFQHIINNMEIKRDYQSYATSVFSWHR